MTEEIFGPVLPVISFRNITEVIDHINDGDKPLAVYFFGTVRNNANKERLEVETSSGAFVTNEAIIQIINHEFGFGGVGASGYGRYGGWEGYKQWSNPKSVMIKPSFYGYPANQLVAPFTPAK
jgi:aldehyde dehydrogenase (NAD+)